MKYLIYWLFERKIIKDNNIFSRCLEKILLCFAFIYKKKKLNLDQALQTENRDPRSKQKVYWFQYTKTNPLF